MMRNNNKKGGMKHRHGGRRFNGGGGGNNRQSEHQNIARQKHHASQMRDKFQTLARDAQASGERVDAEYYLQHVDHYMRVLADIAEIEAVRFANQRDQQQSADANEEGAEDITKDAQDSSGDAAFENTDASEAPRQHRRPARAPRAQHEAGADGVKHAPKQSQDIPLPASILSEIPASNA